MATPHPPPRARVSRGRLASGAVVLIAAYVTVRLGYAIPLFFYGVPLLIGISAAYVLWRMDPAMSLSLAIVLTPISGHWTDVGLPGGYIAPDRLLVLGALAVIALRGPWMADRPPLARHPAHVCLALAVAYALISAIAAKRLGDQAAVIKLLEAFGVLPFLAFFLAPAAFQAQRSRAILLACLVGLGGYLALTALFETVGLTALVFPKYINDPTVGIHFGRARGPFVEAVSNGEGLFGAGIAAVIALGAWQRRWAKVLAFVVAVGCVIGLLFTLQRSVWVGAIVASLVAAVAARELRRHIIPVAIGTALVLVVAIVSIPGLHDLVASRAQQSRTVWDRENLIQAAQNVLEVKPLVGLGWENFAQNSADYFELGDVPLTASSLEVHNVFLGYASQLGLIGAGLWIIGLVAGVGGALMTKIGPELRPWKIGLLAYAVFFVVVSNFVPPQVFPNLLLWLLAGVVWSARVPSGTVARRAPRSAPSSGDGVLADVRGDRRRAR